MKPDDYRALGLDLSHAERLVFTRPITFGAFSITGGHKTMSVERSERVVFNVRRGERPNVKNISVEELEAAHESTAHMRCGRTVHPDIVTFVSRLWRDDAEELAHKTGRDASLCMSAVLRRKPWYALAFPAVTDGGPYDVDLHEVRA